MTHATPQSDSYRHVLKYTSMFGSVQGLNILIGLVRNKAVAVLLGPMGMGLVSLLITSMNFIVQATSLGVSFSAVRHIAELHDKGDRRALEAYIGVVRQWSVVAALLGMVVCVAVGPLLNALSFSWGDHTLHFMLLAPAVAMTGIGGGEMAILKGTKRLRQIATTQIVASAASLVVTVPLYYFFNQKAIVPTITLMALATLAPAMAASTSHYPYRLRLSRRSLAGSRPMLRLGIAFTVAAAFGSGSDMLTRALLNKVADLDTVGLFNAAYVITITYAGMVFSSMDSDYYPRLSAVNHDNRHVSDMVNRQMEVSVLLVAPLLAALITLLPFILPLLFSQAFTPIATMAQTTTLAMLIKAMSLPIAYINLAKGQWKPYLAFEAAYAIAFVAAVPLCFMGWGLTGAGWAIVAVHAIELLALAAYCHSRHGLRMEPNTLKAIGAAAPLLIAAYASAMTTQGVAYWCLGATLSAMLSAYSLCRLRRMRKA